MRPKELDQRFGFYSCQQKNRIGVQGVPTSLRDNMPSPFDNDKRKVLHPLEHANSQFPITPLRIEAVRVPDQWLNFKRAVDSNGHVLREPPEAERVCDEVYASC